MHSRGPRLLSVASSSTQLCCSWNEWERYIYRLAAEVRHVEHPRTFNRDKLRSWYVSVVLITLTSLAQSQQQAALGQMQLLKAIHALAPTAAPTATTSVQSTSTSTMSAPAAATSADTERDPTDAQRVVKTHWQAKYLALSKEEPPTKLE